MIKNRNPLGGLIALTQRTGLSGIALLPAAIA